MSCRNPAASVARVLELHVVKARLEQEAVQPVHGKIECRAELAGQRLMGKPCKGFNKRRIWPALSVEKWGRGLYRERMSLFSLRSQEMETRKK